MLNNIAIEYDILLKYPVDPPFSPSLKYPEYRFNEFSSEPNELYSRVRNLFFNLGLDAENYDSERWNPFKDFILPGNRVVIKPNWVHHANPLNEDISGLVSHPSIIRVIIDYTLIALENTGEIIIGDAPVLSADFEILKSKLGIEKILKFYSGKTNVKISVEDFRQEIKRYDKSGNIIFHKRINDAIFVNVDLKHNSYLSSIADKINRFRVTNYNHRKMFEYHGPGKNIYVIHKSVLNSDVLINIPKIKTHRKAGLSCCLKNSVGINCSKDALVHHLKGSKKCGGDAYPYFNILKYMNEYIYDKREGNTSKNLQKLLTFIIGINNGLIKKLKLNTVFEGDWHGNNTLWRMILDINNILFYSDKNGEMTDTIQRKIFYLVDGIIGGEKEGPLKPDNKFAGVLIAGWNPVIIDIIAATLINFDYGKINVIMKALDNKLFGFGQENLNDIRICFNNEYLALKDLGTITKFEPSNGWKNYIEKENSSSNVF